MFFDDDSSSGVSSDLRHATTLALAMEGLWGMGGQYGSYAVTPAPHDAHPVADGQDRAVFETALGKRAEAHLTAVAERSSALLQENRGHVLALAHALERYKTITGDDVEAVMEGTEGPLVDGRPYHTPEFAATLEVYHQQVMVAHRARDMAMPLPIPVPGVKQAEPIPAWQPTWQQELDPNAEN
jgi:cell division protease FtsH